VEESAGGPDGDDAGRLQRGQEAVRPVTRRSLAPFARDAAHLDRLLADTDLFERLRESDFTGPDWDYVAVNALIRYGKAVLVAWMRSGEIWAQLAQQRGIRGLPEPPTWEWAQPDAWETVADDTLLVAVVKFRDTVLRTGYWTPRGGASLRTFFIGQCLIRFPNVYRSWATEAWARYRERPGDAEDWLYALPGDQLGTAARVTLQDQVIRELGDLDERTRRVLQLREAGYDQNEIADQLGLNRKLVENAVARQARRGRKRRGA
jgi:hypothetical protein